MMRLEVRNGPELSRIQSALDQYRAEYGEYPPAAGARQVVMHLYRTRDAREVIHAMARFKRDFTKLDESEALVFWLSRAADNELLGRAARPIYDFDTSRLVDSDQDGWLEYTDRRGNAFRYDGETVAIPCPETKRLITVDYLDSEYAQH